MYFDIYLLYIIIKLHNVVIKNFIYKSNIIKHRTFRLLNILIDIKPFISF